MYWMKNRSFWRAFSYAWEGIVQAVRQERNVRFHLIAAAYVLYFARFYTLSPPTWGLLLLLIACVLAAELFNTAIEAAVDLLGPQPSPLAKLAKDAAAGAVLVLALVSIWIGLLLFWDLDVFREILRYHVSHPFAIILLLLSAMLAYCFVFKPDLFYKRKKGD